MYNKKTKSKNQSSAAAVAAPGVVTSASSATAATVTVTKKLRGNQVTHWIECSRKKDPLFADYTSKCDDDDGGDGEHADGEHCALPHHHHQQHGSTNSTPQHQHVHSPHHDQHDTDALTVEDVLEAMDAKLVEEAMGVLQEGSTLWKVKSFSSWYRRRYVFDMDNRRILYEGSRKLPCLEPSDIIEIHDMHDVRKGWKTDTFNKIATRVHKKKSNSTPQKQKQQRNTATDSSSSSPKASPSKNKTSAMEEPCCFSVIYGPDHRTLDLVCPSETLCNSWVRGLSHLIAVHRSEEREQNYKNWLKDQFRKADLDRSGGLNFSECVNLLRQLNIEMNRAHAKHLFDEANTNRNQRNAEDVIDEEEFVTFYNLLKSRPELEELFLKYTGSSPMMGPYQLQTFLKQEQKMRNITLDDARDIIDVYEPSQAKAEGFMSLDGFQKMLLSDPMDVFNISHRTVYQDMKQPLSHYYMASSHNTYLMADQLAGDSSVEGYIRALKSGCRCVELDLWDGPDGEPIIYHGYTLTSRILLKDVLQDALKPYSFAASEYPVILSLENHLSVEQQKVLAKHLNNILGDMLYTDPISPDMSNLPSPFELKRKIIVKGKKLDEDVVGDEEVSDSEGEDEDHHRHHHHQGGHSGEETTSPTQRKNLEERKKLAKELSDLVNICKAVHFKSFEESKRKGKWYEMSSLSERQATSHIDSDLAAFVEYNERQVIRIYPAGKRQGSSNYDPIPFWNVGCHIVALNYQTLDKNMRHNTARFRDNGNCGFVLKPQFLRGGDPREIEVGLLRNRFRKILHIKVISGQHVPKPNQATTGEIIDPYVVMQIHGHPSDEQEHRTTHVHNNGFNPVWNESFKMEIKMPDLAFLNFIVKDYSASGRDETLGGFCLAFNSLQVGYRHVHLVDKYNRSLDPASIFVNVNIE